MKHIGFTVAAFLTLLAVPALANPCQVVGGTLLTNIGAIEGVTNLGPVSGDLQGSLAATVKGQDNDGNFLIQHYWVTSSGETILLKLAVLKPVATSDPNVVAVLWGNYSSDIVGYWKDRLFRNRRFQRENVGAALQRQGLLLKSFLLSDTA